MAIAFHFAARSDIGLVRSENQDSGYAGPHLLVVADGMGGHAGGDIASSVAIGRLVELDGNSIGGREAGEELSNAIAAANRELGSLVTSQPELKGMGTTVTALLRSRNTLTLAHIGDSRAYMLRGDRFTQLTHDHSFVQTLVDEGRITQEEAATHPQRALVTRVLTGQPDDEPDLAVREATAGDRYLLCSDGLSGYVGADTIEEILRAGDPPGRTADVLVDLARRAGAPDNVTVVVADVVDMSTAAAPPTQPQVVGAASLARTGTRAVPVSPAEKAAALRSPEAEEDTDERRVRLAEQDSGSRRGRVLRAVGAVLAVLVILAGGAYAAWAWTQQQVYVGAQDGRVAVFRGVSQDLGPISLSTATEVTDISLDDLPEYFRGQVESTVTVDNRAQADQLVADLRSQADACARLKAKGKECGSTTATSTATSSPGTSPRTSTSGATPSGSATSTGGTPNTRSTTVVTP